MILADPIGVRLERLLQVPLRSWDEAFMLLLDSLLLERYYRTNDQEDLKRHLDAMALRWGGEG